MFHNNNNYVCAFGRIEIKMYYKLLLLRCLENFRKKYPITLFKLRWLSRISYYWLLTTTTSLLFHKFLFCYNDLALTFEVHLSLLVYNKLQYKLYDIHSNSLWWMFIIRVQYNIINIFSVQRPKFIVHGNKWKRFSWNRQQEKWHIRSSPTNG